MGTYKSNEAAINQAQEFMNKSLQGAGHAEYQQLTDRRKELIVELSTVTKRLHEIEGTKSTSTFRGGSYPQRTP